MKKEGDFLSVSVVNHVLEWDSNVSIEERMGVIALASVIL